MTRKLAEVMTDLISANNHALDRVCDGPTTVSPRSDATKASRCLSQQTPIRLQSAGFREAGLERQF